MPSEAAALPVVSEAVAEAIDAEILAAFDRATAIMERDHVDGIDGTRAALSHALVVAIVAERNGVDPVAVVMAAQELHLMAKGITRGG